MPIVPFIFRTSGFIMVADKGLFVKLWPRRMRFFPWRALWVPEPSPSVPRSPEIPQVVSSGSRSVPRRLNRHWRAFLGYGREELQVYQRSGGTRRVLFLPPLPRDPTARGVLYHEVYERWLAATEGQTASLDE
jgi:hypothetical protein